MPAPEFLARNSGAGIFFCWHFFPLFGRMFDTRSQGLRHSLDTTPVEETSEQVEMITSLCPAGDFLERARPGTLRVLCRKWPIK
jgi:hypothetical protein